MSLNDSLVNPKADKWWIEELRIALIKYHLKKRATTPPTS
tara:strand:- start:1002 stop:1121 length:120 start_codon:yes stop_codon:yes gene_type:complete